MILGSISYINLDNGKCYEFNVNLVVFICCVCGLYFKEKYVIYNGLVIFGLLFDFVFYFYNNYCVLLKKGSGFYFYLFKL